MSERRSGASMSGNCTKRDTTKETAGGSYLTCTFVMLREAGQNCFQAPLES